MLRRIIVSFAESMFAAILVCVLIAGFLYAVSVLPLRVTTTLVIGLGVVLPLFLVVVILLRRWSERS